VRGSGGRERTVTRAPTFDSTQIREDFQIAGHLYSFLTESRIFKLETLNFTTKQLSCGWKSLMETR
jgi:hypothetical protein